MADDLFTASGTKVFIGPAIDSTTDTKAEYEALTWVEIGLVENLGEFGDQANAVTGAVLGDSRTRKAKGARDAGDMTITCFDNAADLGQQAAVAAEATKNNYAFKVQYANRPEPLGTDGVDYFRGLVMSKRKNVGTNDNIMRRTFAVAINSAVLEVAPAEAP
jgi:hypothetical protein